MSDLIVGWSSKRCGVEFVLDDNVVHLIPRKTSEEKPALWNSSSDKDRFKQTALRDAQFYRKLRKTKRTIDPALYEDRACAWGLENAVSVAEAHRSIENKNRLVRRVLEVQECHLGSRDEIEELIAAESRKLSQFSRDRAHKIGVFYAKAIDNQENRVSPLNVNLDEETKIRSNQLKKQTSMKGFFSRLSSLGSQTPSSVGC
mmetsp:Transcript_5576/g.12159  ORF Transcript_5576/g.12159 Transcript_5576/m.12159 type:complete len:202 (+) Transcript_5576:95-700(+)|eukprot:CAMPEP_0171342098 /NCGR_PEP_ID=MMETSP0878-20121228/13257_1 /TAXON_ID=67004 /ORGANISM="Thalassiosira weissflogii, Strain CCMP1336" /LENGTH=201 /DNA_ID=CAMNT_0011844657 /DNA_START=248 /DNA_END=853 /DNA_ORIENTATION=+